LIEARVRACLIDHDISIDLDTDDLTRLLFSPRFFSTGFAKEMAKACAGRYYCLPGVAGAQLGSAVSAEVAAAAAAAEAAQQTSGSGLYSS